MTGLQRQQQQNLRSLLSWFLSPASGSIDRESGHVSRMIARFLSTGYQVSDWGSSSRQRTPLTVTAPPFDAAAFPTADADYLAPLRALQERVVADFEPFVSHFFLHGSFATRDYVRGWSDVDTFVVVAKETFHSPDALLDLRKLCFDSHPYLTQVDPLQHHGFIVVTEYDLPAYPGIFLPLEVLRRAVSLLPGHDTIAAAVEDSRQDFRDSLIARRDLFEAAATTGAFHHHPYRGEYLRAGFANAHNAMFQFKYMLAVLMNLPATYLSAVGESCYKRESFDRCAHLFADEWDIIDRASRVRESWAREETVPFVGNAIPDWVRDVVGPRYFECGYRLADAMVRKVDARVA